MRIRRAEASFSDAQETDGSARKSREEAVEPFQPRQEWQGSTDVG